MLPCSPRTGPRAGERRTLTIDASVRPLPARVVLRADPTGCGHGRRSAALAAAVCDGGRPGCVVGARRPRGDDRDGGRSVGGRGDAEGSREPPCVFRSFAITIDAIRRHRLQSRRNGDCWRRGGSLRWSWPRPNFISPPTCLRQAAIRLLRACARLVGIHEAHASIESELAEDTAVVEVRWPSLSLPAAV